MEYFKIFLSSVLSVCVLFISAKIIGNKQMSQLNMFDYINGITIGSIAADMAIHLDNNIFYPLIAIAVYTVIIFFIDFLSSKNLKARRFFTGKSIILMDRGQLLYDNFKTAKIDLNEFLTQCHINGFFNLEDIETAMLEQNGMISFLPRSVSRPVTPKDMTLTPELDRPFFCVVTDGEILHINCVQSGLTVEKLNLELKSRNLKLEDIYAGFYDGKKLLLYQKTMKGNSNDIAQ